MKVYLRRIISRMGFRLLKEGGLDGLVPYINGPRGNQTFDELQSTLKIEAESGEWLSKATTVTATASAKNGAAASDNTNNNNNNNNMVHKLRNFGCVLVA